MLNNFIRYTTAILLLLGILFIGMTIINGFKVIPYEVSKVSSGNLISDGSFENFNQNPGDCCDKTAGSPNIFAGKSQDSFSGIYSLNLTAYNHCACINIEAGKIINTEKYLMIVYSKGDNPRFCNWVSGDNDCLVNKKILKSENWTKTLQILSFTNKSKSAIIYFYADSLDGDSITNLYDDLQVKKLIPVNNNIIFQSNNQYIIKTSSDNIVHNPTAEKISEDGYYLVTGNPDITLQFPWSEIVLMVLMMLIVIRLLFRKQVIALEKGFEKSIMHKEYH